MDSATSRIVPSTRLHLITAVLTLLLTGMTAGQVVEKPEPQLNWKDGPARVNLRLPMVSIDVPAGMAYVDQPRDIALVSEYWEDPTAREALAILGPKGADWVVVVFSDPSAIIGENGRSWLNSGGSEGMLKRFQAQLYRRSSREQAAGRLGSRIVGWAGEPVYVGGDRRSLFLPFAEVDDDGQERVRAYGWVANSKASVHFAAVLSKVQAASVFPQVKTLMDTVVLPYVPEPERPKPVVQPPSKPKQKQWYEQVIEKLGGNETTVRKFETGVLIFIGAAFLIHFINVLKSRLRCPARPNHGSGQEQSLPATPQQPPPPPEHGRFAD